MTTVLQLSHVLKNRPAIEPADGVRLRTYRSDDDIRRWIDIRHKSFAHQRLGVSRWNCEDFQREFISKRWWRPDHLWFAESEPATESEVPETVGTVTLALRGSGEEAKPVVHWLAVVPRWRRRGIGRLLIKRLEATCWDAGYRQVWLETHVAWTAAARLYESLGYRPARLDQQ